MYETDFEYTDRPIALRDSSLVDDVWYNDKNRELALSLNEAVYVYSGVDRTTYLAFINAPSLGRAYREIKRNYGPGRELGWVEDLVFSEAKQPALAAVGTPKNLTYAAGATITSDSLTSANMSNVEVTNDKTFTLAPVQNKNPEYDATVRFKIVGSDREREYSTKVGESWLDAITALDEIASALDLEFEVKEVTIHY